MAIYIYTGNPTYGQSTKDIKLPNVSEGFTIYEDITPNVTEINTVDSTEIAYMDKYPDSFEVQ